MRERGRERQIRLHEQREQVVVRRTAGRRRILKRRIARLLLVLVEAVAEHAQHVGFLVECRKARLHRRHFGLDCGRHWRRRSRMFALLLQELFHKLLQALNLIVLCEEM